MGNRGPLRFRRHRSIRRALPAAFGEMGGGQTTDGSSMAAASRSRQRPSRGYRKPASTGAATDVMVIQIKLLHRSPVSSPFPPRAA